MAGRKAESRANSGTRDGANRGLQVHLWRMADAFRGLTDAAKVLRMATRPVAPTPRKCGSCAHRGMCTAGRSVGVLR